MKKTLAVLGCAGLSLALGACGDDDKDKGATTTKTFKVIERETDTFGFVDAPPTTTIGKEGPEKFSPGDQTSFRSDLIRGGKDVGDLLATCTVVSGTSFKDALVTCHGIYTLPEGTLTAQVGGQVFSTDHLVGVITGGTGAYANATGTFASPNNSNRNLTTFTLRIPSD